MATGSPYAALADGRLEVDRLRIALAGLELPRGSDGQIRLAVDVTPWPRPDAECSLQRAHAHRPCRCDGVRQTIPGWAVLDRRGAGVRAIVADGPVGRGAPGPWAGRHGGDR